LYIAAPNYRASPAGMIHNRSNSFCTEEYYSR
jgi:hypothetical protein